MYIGVDKRLLKPHPGPPKWLALQGFELSVGSNGSCGGSVIAFPPNLAPEGFALFSRFYRGQSTVPLGLNVNHDGDALEARGSHSCAAMYFVVVVEVGQEEAAREVDVGPVVMHRGVSRVVSTRGLRVTSIGEGVDWSSNERAFLRATNETCERSREFHGLQSWIWSIA